MWQDSIQLQAESVTIDGFPMAELFPACVEELKGSYKMTTIDKLDELLSEQSTNKFDLCILSEQKNALMDDIIAKVDTTVDEMNPLGVTQVDYQERGDRQMEILQRAITEYNRQLKIFEKIEQDFYTAILKAEEDLYEDFAKIAEQVMSLDSEEDQTELLRSIDEAILKIQELAEELIEN